MLNINGKQLHTLMIKNNRSFKGSAELLGISEEELRALLLRERFEDEDLEFIKDWMGKLNLFILADDPFEAGSMWRDEITKRENLRCQLQAWLNDVYLQMEELYMIVKKGQPFFYKNKGMAGKYQDIIYCKANKELTPLLNGINFTYGNNRFAIGTHWRDIYLLFEREFSKLNQLLPGRIADLEELYIIVESGQRDLFRKKGMEDKYQLIKSARIYMEDWFSKLSR